MTAHERSGWRDLDLSQRHRIYGYNSPLTDVDMVMFGDFSTFSSLFGVEFDQLMPVGIVDYKFCQVPVHGAPVIAQKNLADHWVNPRTNKVGIPFFQVQYWKNPWAFLVYPFNSRALEIVQVPGAYMTELEYVSFLYRMRGRKCPERFVWRDGTEAKLDDIRHPSWPQTVAA
jgi:hypothetical protein